MLVWQSSDVHLPVARIPQRPRRHDRLEIYSWTGPAPVAPDGKGTGGINLATIQGTPPGGGGSADIAAANLTTFISPTIGDSDTYTHAAYLLSLNITDSVSGDTKAVTLGGFFDGTVTAANVSLTNSFGTAPAPLTIGKNVYTVVLDSYKTPGVHGAAPGSLGAIVSVVPAAGADTLVSISIWSSQKCRNPPACSWPVWRCPRSDWLTAVVGKGSRPGDRWLSEPATQARKRLTLA